MPTQPKPRIAPDEYLLNPHVIIEVLSESTAAWDRSGKFEHYRSIASFGEYVVVAEDRVYVEHWVRQADGTWTFSALNRAEDEIGLGSIGVRLALADAYDKVHFERAETGG
jgi:Uma2 family endonuclease